MVFGSSTREQCLTACCANVDSVSDHHDVSALAPLVHGVNIKLEKAGGLRAAIKTLAAARSQQPPLRVWIGATSPSSFNRSVCNLSDVCTACLRGWNVRHNGRQHAQLTYRSASHALGRPWIRGRGRTAAGQGRITSLRRRSVFATARSAPFHAEFVVLTPLISRLYLAIRRQDQLARLRCGAIGGSQ